MLLQSAISLLNEKLHELVDNYLPNSIGEILIVHRSKHNVLESSKTDCRFNYKKYKEIINQEYDKVI